MADNVTTPTPDGTAFAFDEVTIGGLVVKVARGKMGFGADGLYTEVDSLNPFPVSVIGGLELGSASLTALETIDLGAASLAALESVTVGGTVELGTASLAALETITVGGAVELGATSLAALETITVGGNVELGATSLAALESITATGPLTDAQLRALAVPVSLPASETVIGAIAGLADLIDVTLSLDTLIYAAGDVLADTQALANAVRVNGGRAILQSLTVVDEDDQGQPLDLVFFGATQSLGIENAAVSITDLAARDILGIVPVVAADFIDLGGVRTATLRNVGLLLEAAAASRDLFVGAISRGTGTYTLNGLRLRLGLLLS